MVELAYTASLKLAAERHTGSNPVIPSDHIKPIQCGFKSHQGHAEGICGKQKQVGEPQIPDRSSHILQAQQRCELWNEQRRCNRPN